MVFSLIGSLFIRVFLSPNALKVLCFYSDHYARLPLVTLLGGLHVGIRCILFMVDQVNVVLVIGSSLLSKQAQLGPC